MISVLVWVTAGLFSIPARNAMEITLAITSAYGTHLAIDSFTKEGIYTFPKGFEVRRWIKGLLRGDTMAWEYWRLFRIEEIKGWKIGRNNDDPILNACVSLPSLLIIIFFVALMPKPV